MDDAQMGHAGMAGEQQKVYSSIHYILSTTTLVLVKPCAASDVQSRSTASGVDDGQQLTNDQIDQTVDRGTMLGRLKLGNIFPLVKTFGKSDKQVSNDQGQGLPVAGHFELEVAVVAGTKRR
ncbi:hypothetical protein H6F86_25830 [Phormidium sp. FACHB-592]|uniref:Uncharacterized protein n=1 Tax=Stenomitos frigidus AS-A4 TaxID=2933935 RepID=A0ABV0KTJ7_9CYAN|nr:hypothetical protein [Phormidium sp. FACHB-592]MBD2077235.1 hypothetical protein [Phormidium sp. FACHB-592]